MVVQGILALALALPTGLLFGVGYGTGVRIGYEQVYPLLFPQDSENRNVAPTVDNIKRINNIYNTIGGKEASQMGIASGLAGAMQEINKNPDFQALEALELRLSGRTQSRLGLDVPLKETSISDFPSGSSLDPNSPNFDPDYFILVQKQQAANAPLPTNLGDASQLNTFTVGPNLTAAQLKTAKDLRENAEWVAFSTAAGKRKANISKMNGQIAFNKHKQRGYVATPQQVAYLKLQRRKLVEMSNRYRDPNNAIRENALRLRKELASGQYQIKL